MSTEINKITTDIVDQAEQQVEENYKLQKKQLIDSINQNPTRQKNLIRYMNIVLDLTHTMKTVDLNPSRIAVTINNLIKFIPFYFDQNPLSVLGIATCNDQNCVQQIDFNSDESIFTKQLKGKSRLNDVSDTGKLSLQAIIEQQIKLFKDVPLHANKEVLLIQSSPSTSDLGDIFEYIEKIKQCNITVSIISLNSKTQVFNKLTNQTGGKYNTILDENDYWQQLKAYSEIPSFNPDKIKIELLKVGFPTFTADTSFRICSCHYLQVNEFYTCPYCLAKNCSIPGTCSVCKTNLISPLHLARTQTSSQFLNSFKLKIQENQMEIENNKDKNTQLICGGCDQQIIDQEITFCEDCKQHFCLDCDIYIHKNLKTCVSCI